MRDAEEQSPYQLWKPLEENSTTSTEFSFDTIDDFDDHIEQSIPNYHLLSDAIRDLSTFFVRPDTAVVDIGCSTGKLLRSISHSGEKVGIDISAHLLPESDDQTEFILDDLTQMNRYCRKSASLFLSVFTLQFIASEHRRSIVAKIYDELVMGGAFIWAEKVQEPKGRYELIMNNAYYDFKRKKFTPVQIMNKERDLRCLMKPNESFENQEIAFDAGFTEGICFWKFFNFEAWLYIK